MKPNINLIIWLCGAGAVILAVMMLLLVFPKRTEGEENKKMEVLIGTYGNNLYRYSFNEETLEFNQTGQAESVNASYVIKDRDRIYAVCENGGKSGLYSFDKDLKAISDLRPTGDDPCFIMTDDNYIYTADYSGGSMTAIPKYDGEAVTLKFSGNGPIVGRQESSHIHQIKQIPGKEKWMLATDLGADKIRIISKENGLRHITDIECPAGSGPRHMEFSNDGNILYCIAELSGKVLVYAIDSTDGTPTFSLIQEVQADEVNAGGSADIHIHPSGKFLYTSHRLDNDGIAIFRIEEDGKIEKTGYARTARHPRNFMITPDGRFLLAACRDDKVIQVFSIGGDGLLTLTPSVLRLEKDMPSSITEYLHP